MDKACLLWLQTLQLPTNEYQIKSFSSLDICRTSPSRPSSRGCGPRWVWGPWPCGRAWRGCPPRCPPPALYRPSAGPPWPWSQRSPLQHQEVEGNTSGGETHLKTTHTHTHNCKARHIQLTINTQSWQSYYGKLVSQNTQWIIQIHAQNVFSHIHSIGGTWHTLTSHTPQHENRMEGEVTSLNKKDGWRERVRQTCMSHCFRVTETEWEELQYSQWNFGSLTSGVIQKCQSYNEWPNIQSYIQCTGPWQNTESSSDRS